MNKTVLLVEDDPDARASLTRTLVRETYTCLTAESVDEALAAAKRAPFLDVVVSDVVLGSDESGGIRLIQCLREAAV